MGYVLIILNVLGCLSVPVQAIVKHRKEKKLEHQHELQVGQDSIKRSDTIIQYQKGIK